MAVPLIILRMESAYLRMVRERLDFFRWLPCSTEILLLQLMTIQEKKILARVVEIQKERLGYYTIFSGS